MISQIRLNDGKGQYIGTRTRISGTYQLPFH